MNLIRKIKTNPSYMPNTLINKQAPILLKKPLSNLGSYNGNAILLPQAKVTSFGWAIPGSQSKRSRILKKNTRNIDWFVKWANLAIKKRFINQ